MITIITGGSGSGKSEFAEMKAVDLESDNLIYIATMHPYDDECLKKIDRHKEMRRSKNFKTIECFTNLKSVDIKEGSTVLLDCISNIIANEMFSEDGAKENTVESILEGVKHLSKKAKNLIIVTNEIFSDGLEYDEETMRYIRYSAKINSEIGKLADEVIEVVYTIPIYHKGGKS